MSGTFQKLALAASGAVLLTLSAAELAPASARGEDAELPLKPARQLQFDTSEGTWLSLDLSPDGRRIVFDLLGDLYTLDSRGGTATAITSGLAFDAQPVYAPDGKRLAFVSDRSGAENLWVAAADGSGARRITALNDDTVLTSPASSCGASPRRARGPASCWSRSRQRRTSRATAGRALPARRRRPTAASSITRRMSATRAPIACPNGRSAAAIFGPAPKRR